MSANARLRGQRDSTYVRVSAHLEVLHGRIRVALPSESRKVARHQLQSLEIASITQWVLIAVSEAYVCAVKAEVGQVRVSIRVARCDGAACESRGSEVVGVVASICAVDVVVVSNLESVGGRAGVDCGFVDAAEGLVCGDTLADVEGVERQVSAVIVWEQSRVDGELSVLCGDTETGLDTFGERRDVCWGEVGEGSTWEAQSVFISRIELKNHNRLTIVGCGTEQHWNVRSAIVALGDDKLLCVDDTAVLDNIAGNCIVVLDRLSRYCLQARNLRVNGSLVASKTSEDLLACNGVGLVHGVVRAVGGTVVAIQSKSATSAKVTLRNRSSNQVLADNSGRAEKSTNGSCTSATADLLTMLAMEDVEVGIMCELTIVTRLGSPPNWAMFFFTHSKAVIWSPIPKFPLISVPGIARNPSVDKR